MEQDDNVEEIEEVVVEEPKEEKPKKVASKLILELAFRPGDEVSFGGYDFEIEKVEGKRISLLRTDVN